MRPETIRERAAAIRMPNKVLAEKTGLWENTIGRTLTGRTSPNLTTCDAIEAAVIAEELRLRDYLNALHPVAANEPEKVS